MDQKILTYVLDQFYLIYPNSKDVNIGWSKDADIIVANNGCSFFNDEKAKPDKHVWLWCESLAIPFFFTDIEQDICVKKGDKVHINYDVISMIFYFLSGWQEKYAAQLDEYGRFPYAESIQCDLKFVDVPVVAYYFKVIAQAIGMITGKVPRPINLGESTTVLLTHDIDNCETGFVQGGMWELKRGRIDQAIDLLFKKLFHNDVWFNIREIILLELKEGVRSTFFFLTKSGIVNRVANADYNIKERKYQQALLDVEQAESEVAIHGSYGTSSCSKQFLEEAQKLGSPVGNRFHFLSYDSNTTPSVLDSANMKYDSSLGFAEIIGFRNATCYPFYPFDLSAFKSCSHVELPLVAMDTTLHHTKYMNLVPQVAQKALLGLFDKVDHLNGVFTILWHNNYFSKHKYPGWKQLYQNFINHAKCKKASFKTAKELAFQVEEIKGNHAI